MTWRVLVPVGLLSLLIGLVLYLPAALMASWVQVPGLQLAGVTGTALHGHVQQARYQGATISNIDWAWHPSALLSGHIGTSITIATQSGQLKANASLSSSGKTVLTHAHGDIPITQLATLAGYTFVPIKGLLDISDGAITLDKNQAIVSAKGKLRVTGAQWTLMKPAAVLGNYTARVGSKKGQTTLTIIDSKGPLALKGNAQINTRGSFSLNVKLRARSGADKRLKGLLKQTGKPDAQGWYRVHLQGRL